MVIWRVLSKELREREEQLIRACEAANHSTEVHDIENSFDALVDDSDAVQERW